MRCCIVRDLLSGYIDGLNSEETDAEIKRHLADCRACRDIYEKMSADIPQKLRSVNTDIDFFGKLKGRVRRRNIIIALLTCLLVSGMLVFVWNYKIPLAFDGNRMAAEEFPVIVLKSGKGKIRWQELDSEAQEDIRLRENADCLHLVRLSYQEINHLSEWSGGRTIQRNGQNIRVVYYCYYKTIWNHVFSDSGFIDYSEGGSSYGSDIYGDSFESADYKPQLREIYYLPVRNLYKIEELSDEEFDALRLREGTTLVWKGIV